VTLTCEVSELEAVFAAAPEVATSQLATNNVRDAYLKATGRAPAEDVAAPKEEAPAEGSGRKNVVGDDCPM
jgi:hypothetical protein